MSRNGNSRLRAAYFPVVENEDDLVDVLSRAAWFVSFTPLERIDVLVADERLANAEWTVAPGMDPAIADRFAELRERVRLVPARNASSVAEVIADAPRILRWSQSVPDWLPPAEVADLLNAKELYEVDPRQVRMEGANYIDVSSRLMGAERTLVEEQRRRFDAVAETLGTFDEAVVIATGPSAARYAELDYEGKLGVVCNTVILDDALMQRVQPKFLVFADPIFHFGPSQFAADFRASLRRAADRHDFTIVMPIKYQPIFVSAVPELAERTVAIPFRKNREFNFDLRADFELRTTANVLTLAMVPLAATFARNIGFLGCDGRPLTEDRYFWKHNPKTQINDKMGNIQEVHPSFFIRDYNDYYLEHCRTLAEQLDAGERAGRSFRSLAPSHIPALRQRVDPPAEDAGAAATRFPRLLVVDFTRAGALSATGKLKERLLEGWPEDRFMQVHSPRKDEYKLAFSVSEPSSDRVVSREHVLDEVELFDPEVVYYRPTSDHPQLLALAEEILDRHPVPVVTHVMDDWPTRVTRTDPARGARLDRQLRAILARSAKALSISERMSEVFSERYGVPFEPVANGIDVALARAAHEAASAAKRDRPGFVLRYCGALAADMTLQTVVDVAHAVDSLQDELDIRLEVYTMPLWQKGFQEQVAGLRGVSVSDSVPDDEYPALLAGADALLLGYNFDDDSSTYIGLSMPNKLPEYLGSGAAVLAVGPAGVNGIDFVLSRGLGCCVTERDRAQIADALRRLAGDAEYRDTLAATAQSWAFEHLDAAPIVERFQSILRDTARRSRLPATVGPFAREQGAHVDETLAVATLLSGTGPEHVLVDVGAHKGSSSKPFARAGWTVVACEPDASNRAALTEQYGGLANVTIDPRAVSDEAVDSIAFFTSTESTGISTLHPFADSHAQTAAVAVTTLADIVAEHRLDRIDFLKIDVEGFELKVLNGLPWEKVQPAVIECEFEDRKTVPLGYTFADLADLLVARGYTVYVSEWHPILRYGIRHDWHRLFRYPGPLDSADSWGNVIAFLNDPGEQAVASVFSQQLPPGIVRDVATPEPASTPTPVKPAPVEAPPALAGLTPYQRLYWWVRTHNATLFEIGRVTMWSARRVRERLLATASAATLVAALVAVGAWQYGRPVGIAAWAVAGLLVLSAAVLLPALIVLSMVRRLQAQTAAQGESTRARLTRIEGFLRKGWARRDARLAELDRSIGSVLARVEDEARARDRVEAGMGGRIDDGVAVASSAAQAAAEAQMRVEQLEAASGALHARVREEIAPGLADARAELERLRKAGPAPGPAPARDARLAAELEELRARVDEASASFRVSDPRSWPPVGRPAGPVDRRWSLAFAGAEGVQPVTHRHLFSYEIGDTVSRGPVLALQEIRSFGVHAVSWTLRRADAGGVGVVVAVKPLARRFVELSLQGLPEPVVVRFDVERGVVVASSGPNDAAATIQGDGDPEGWRLCGIRATVPNAPVTIRLALVPDAAAPVEYEGEGQGLLVTDPHVVVI